MTRCTDCRRAGYCAPDCPIAPWNQEPASYPVSGFAYLLRQRRWVGWPLDRRETVFYNDRLELTRSVFWLEDGEP